MITEKTTVALRVLSSINNREQPADRDVLLLRAYCPDHRDCEPDELACIVIQEALAEKKRRREAATSDGRALTR